MYFKTSRSLFERTWRLSFIDRIQNLSDIGNSSAASPINGHSGCTNEINKVSKGLRTPCRHVTEYVSFSPCLQYHSSCAPLCGLPSPPPLPSPAQPVPLQRLDCCSSLTWTLRGLDSSRVALPSSSGSPHPRTITGLAYHYQVARPASGRWRRLAGRCA